MNNLVATRKHQKNPENVRFLQYHTSQKYFLGTESEEDFTNLGLGWGDNLKVILKTIIVVKMSIKCDIM